MQLKTQGGFSVAWRWNAESKVTMEQQADKLSYPALDMLCNIEFQPLQYCAPAIL
jgi:hypothetical protein